MASEGAAVYEVPPATSPGTLRGLGSHVWEATYDRRGDRQGIHPSRESTMSLVWSELDYYHFLDFGVAGDLRTEEIRLGPSLYRRTSAGAPYALLHGTPGDSIVLQGTLRAWESAISPFAEQVAFERREDEVIEGRPVRVYKVVLAPQVAPTGDTQLSPEAAGNLSGMAVTPLSLDGHVYVDIETGNRLVAELAGRYVPRRVIGGNDPTDEVLITYRESRSPTQLPPTIKAPPDSRVRDHTQPRTRLPGGRRGPLDRLPNR